MDTSVTGVIGVPQGSCQTVCLVGNVSIIGTGLSETSGVCILIFRAVDGNFEVLFVYFL